MFWSVDGWAGQLGVSTYIGMNITLDAYSCVCFDAIHNGIIVSIKMGKSFTRKKQTNKQKTDGYC